MNMNQLFERLERVTQCAPDRWRAICPAHESTHRTQSLAIRELSDGTVLLKCFAGCGAAEVVAAVGLALGDLFPSTHRVPADGRKPQRPRHWHAIREAVQTLHHECLVVAIAGETLAAGSTLSTDDRDRLCLAAERIRGAVEACR